MHNVPHGTAKLGAKSPPVQDPCDPVAIVLGNMSRSKKGQVDLIQKDFLGHMGLDTGYGRLRVAVKRTKPVAAILLTLADKLMSKVRVASDFFRR